VIAVYAALPAVPEGAAAAALPRTPSLSAASAGTLIVLAVLLVWFGVYPTPLLNLIQVAAAAL
jgi:NADH:ubiquinone oxidoreductase subunit 4 (subunit M)